MIQPYKTRRGRPPSHWSDHLRVKLWYLAVSNLSGVSDYELDMRFGFELGEKPDSAVRPRLFENIRKNNTIPSRGKHWRRPQDIVARVGGYPGLELTLPLYESDFWGVIKEMPPTLFLLNQRVEGFLAKHQLCRLHWEDAIAIIVGSENIDERSCFSRCLKIAFEQLDDLDRLTGLVLLNRQADISGNLEMTEILRSNLDVSLDLFFSARFDWHEAMHYYQLVLENACFGARGLGVGEMNLRSAGETMTRKPVLPIHMVKAFFQQFS